MGVRTVQTMRMTIPRTLLVLLVLTLFAPAASAGTLNGTVKLGGIIMNQTGDRTAVQEIYNVFDGFSINQFSLNGTSSTMDQFTLDLREINLDSRKGSFVYRRSGVFKLTAGYDQSRQAFAPDASVDSRRKDWKAGAEYSPAKWLKFSGNFNYLSRDGDRSSYPLGTTSVLGTGYDNALKVGRVTAQVHRGRIGGAVTYNVSDFSDKLNGSADRTGQVVSARLYVPTTFYDKWTHLLRGAYGTSKLSSNDVDHTLSTFQYTSVIAPLHAIEFKYDFDASRVDDAVSELKTDRFQNSFDATYFHRFGQVSGGYAYETNDDDRTLTYYHSWRAGTVIRYEKYVTARVNYAGRNKTDQEELTLLKDIESNRFRAQLQVQPIDALALGGGYSQRQREFTDIQVEAEGEAANGFIRYTWAGWGMVSGEYSYSTDEYDDRVSKFDTRSDIVTGRVDFDRIKDLRIGSGVTYLDIGGDLDIEKSMVFVECAYTVRDDYHIEAKYNVYNYDDYILLDRYYTANVLRINVGYDFDLK